MEQINDFVSNLDLWVVIVGTVVGTVVGGIVLLVILWLARKTINYAGSILYFNFLHPLARLAHSKIALPFWSKVKSISWRLYLRACSKARRHDKEALLQHLLELRQHAINLELGSELVEENRDNEDAQEELRRVKLVSGGEKISYEKLISYLYPEEFPIESWQYRGGTFFGVEFRWKVGDDGRGQLIPARDS